MKAEKATETKAFDIIFLGRLAEAKNPLRFINIIKKVSLEYPNIKVAIIGDGNLKFDCQKKIKEIGLTENIEMLGFLSNPYGIVKNSRILCMTSKWEGFGLVAVEALALGLPVVASGVGGLPDILDNHCGLLASNDEEFVCELLTLLSDEQYHNGKSEAALERSRELSNIEEYISRIKKIYNG
ncbi:glycosyltransferase [Planococcus faecalis]|uniref:glycosyltransferase n=1 Tax=Planococcus faecalis TaxID=1598147 RepID=UPI0008DAA366|nr:glycosyltransferase [Planococcus faecalis]OHX51976.1 hypothetical protein BB777_03645 [Planococcus faecalis]